MSRLNLWIIITLLVGIWLRLYQITANQFLFYDEGMYLGYNHKFLRLVAANPPHNLSELGVILGLMFKSALSTAKSLWFFILNLRVFIVGSEGWFFARVVSAVAGLATIALTYVWSLRYFQSKRIAIFSAVFLMLLPSHVFYSRLGMQESLSTFLFLSAIYLFMWDKRLHWRTIASAFVLSLVFFTNYRMIIAPIFMIAIEAFTAFLEHRRVDWKKLIAHILVFSGIVFFIGSLYGGVNRYVTFGWMFHQAGDATGKFDPMNFLSYPYYTFALEGIFFAVLFWANINFIARKQWGKLLPFILVLLQMGIFSFAAEKGARYLCVVLPFMAVAAAVSTDYWLSHKQYHNQAKIAVLLACVTMGNISLQLALAKTDYAQIIEVIQSVPNAKIVSTQPLVEQLYLKDQQQIIDCPKDLAELADLYHKGYQYLILDPQAYISWTADQQRFTSPLLGFLETVYEEGDPLLTLPHLNRALLTRFVLDHNERLVNSLRFLFDYKEKYGQIRVYDLQNALRKINGH